MTGFTVQQADIPDYGSVQANSDARELLHW